MGWDVFCYVFGALAVVGPVAILPWYLVTARKKLQDLGRDDDTRRPS